VAWFDQIFRIDVSIHVGIVGDHIFEEFISDLWTSLGFWAGIWAPVIFSTVEITIVWTVDVSCGIFA
jgi:hypothetical protein